MALPIPVRLLCDRIGESEPPPSAEMRAWLRDTARSLAGGAAASATCAPAFVAAARRLGRGPLAAGEPLPGPDDPVPTGSWSVDDAGRAALLVAAAAGSPDSLADLADELYRQGDSREKRAVVRSLPLLPDAGRFAPLALDAGRTNETDLFTALACDNPFAARHYGEQELNKLVMKAAFVGAPLERIVGLDRRANPELARMAMDYVSEQEAALRRFPPDIWLLVAADVTPAALGRMIGYLNHSAAEVRRGAARGLGRAGQARARPFLGDRAAIETDGHVRAAIAQALEEIPP
ncbi:MAG TPA: EboA domain-containing protein [Kofleriaceae bacterium]|nr:EboA domain-containing protein [Kofleriaceae bacterium]